MSCDVPPSGTLQRDWFERLTGFRERGYDETRLQLRVEGDCLRSLVNDRSFVIGNLDLISLAELREQARACQRPGRLRFTKILGDARLLHREPEFDGALFQVASQFNLLEMVAPHITPEHGVAGYENDPTQGPACAIAAGAATIYRNYFVPVGGAFGQTAERQLDGLADVGARLSEQTGLAVSRIWTMRNGYALCTAEGLRAISAWLASADEAARDDLRSRLRIGVHRDVEVTDGYPPALQLVSQAFCSALPVAYSGLPAEHWQPFAELVLEAAYEATLYAAVMNACRRDSNIVLLTRLGGGAFGNDPRWIERALQRALNLAAGWNLDVRLVGFRPDED